MPGDVCKRCGTALGSAQRDCPSCHALVHADRLKELAARASEEQAAGHAAAALAIWHEMLELLPPSSRQHAQLVARIAAAEPSLPARERVARDGRALGRLGAGGAIALALGKLKAFVPMIATMALSIAAYWTAYGWWFALGLVVSIWIHEMGHVIELRRHGVAASLPMFVPGLGAFVRLRQPAPEPRIDARIGLAGPIAGALAAAACVGAHAVTDDRLWLGLAHTGALINLFNLTPLWTLDGSRAFRAMSTLERAACALALGIAVLATGNTMLWLPLIAAAARLFGKSEPGQRDLLATATYVALVAGLAAITALGASTSVRS